MPTRSQKTQARSLAALLTELHNRIEAGPLPEEEGRSVLTMLARVLRTVGETQPVSSPVHDMAEVRGQEHVKRALEVAAAGGHSLALIGPPQSGKRFLARTLPTLLPSSEEHPRPIRALQSGQHMALAREILRAAGGVLLLEALANFDHFQLAPVRDAVELHTVLTEEGAVLPVDLQLVLTLQPCPCGFYNDPVRECVCPVEVLIAYFERIWELASSCCDIEIEVHIVKHTITKLRQGEDSAQIRARVEAAHRRAQVRYQETTLGRNVDLNVLSDIERYCPLDAAGLPLLSLAQQQFRLTPRQQLGIIRVARTIADLAGQETIKPLHLAEAIGYRPNFGRFAR